MCGMEKKEGGSVVPEGLVRATLFLFFRLKNLPGVVLRHPDFD